MARPRKNSLMIKFTLSEDALLKASRYGSYALGRWYKEEERGEGKEAQAIKWFIKAAEEGDRGAQDEIIWELKSGRIKDEEEAKRAFEIIRKNAEDAEKDYGGTNAHAIGYAYREGYGCEVDHKKAFEWLEIAAARYYFE